MPSVPGKVNLIFKPESFQRLVDIPRHAVIGKQITSLPFNTTTTEIVGVHKKAMTARVLNNIHLLLLEPEIFFYQALISSYTSVSDNVRLLVACESPISTSSQLVSISNAVHILANIQFQERYVGRTVREDLKGAFLSISNAHCIDKYRPFPNLIPARCSAVTIAGMTRDFQGTSIIYRIARYVTKSFSAV